MGIKYGCDRTGEADHKRVYIKCHQEACFIGPDRRRVRYDELTQSQWTARLTTLTAGEKIPVVQRNMLTCLAFLLQDVCDYGFNPSKGSHTLVLSQLEDHILTLEDLPSI